MKENRSQSGLWDQQFDPSFDLPPTRVSTKYVICTSPRCGSHFLGHLLHQAGGFGYPLEYVNAANLEVWRRRARAAGIAAPLSYIQSVRTDANGVFGIKVHYSHLKTFLANERDVNGYRFIVLERRDLLRQAVSYAWAAQTKSWISTMPALAPASYDWDFIASKLSEITRGNAGWRGFLAQLGAEPLELTYEEVRADPEGAVQRIGSHLGVAPAREAQSGAFVPKEQADPEKEEWIRRFIAESRERLARAELLPSERKRRTHWTSIFNRRRLRKNRSA